MKDKINCEFSNYSLTEITNGCVVVQVCSMVSLSVSITTTRVKTSGPIVKKKNK